MVNGIKSNHFKITSMTNDKLPVTRARARIYWWRYVVGVCGGDVRRWGNLGNLGKKKIKNPIWRGRARDTPPPGICLAMSPSILYLGGYRDR